MITDKIKRASHRLYTECQKEGVTLIVYAFDEKNALCSMLGLPWTLEYCIADIRRQRDDAVASTRAADKVKP